MKSILLVAPVFPKLSETFIVNKFAGLLKRGYDVTMAVQRFDGEVWDLFPQLAGRPEWKRRVFTQASLFSQGPNAWSALAVLSQSVRLTRAITRTTKLTWAGVKEAVAASASIAAKADILHFEFGSLAPRRAWIGRALGSKVVVSFRGYDLNYVGLDDPDYYAAVWKSADGIHCLGEDLWRRALRRGCPEEMHHVLIPPAIDTIFFARSTIRHSEKVGSPARPLRVLSVGRLEWKKGHEYALAAIRNLRERGVSAELRIAGSGEYIEAIAFCRHQLGLEDCVQLLGPTTAAEVKEEMQRADVFLHAAVSEGFCNAVLEAQAMELPVVTSDADGLPENVVHAVTGFVVPRRNASALTDALERLAGDTDLRLQMGAAGRARVCDRFQLEQQIDAFARFYEEVLGGSTQKAAA